jgi:putative N-acetylmannosamine-6-phosphate epimerase
MHRRSFVAAASLSAAGLAAPRAAGAQARERATPDGRDIPRYAQDAWYDKLPGKHRLFLDSTTIDEASNAVGFAFNFMRSSVSGYNLKDSDQAVVICLRHYSTELAISNELWAKYDVLRNTKYKDPETGKKVKGGNIFRPGSTKPKSAAEPFTLDGLARRGVHFAICGVATRGLAAMIAGKGASRDRMEEVLDELVKSMPENSHVMASGILAAQRAGEYGYTIIKG